jgi:hypothetical protein
MYLSPYEISCSHLYNIPQVALLKEDVFKVPTFIGEFPDDIQSHCMVYNYCYHNKFYRYWFPGN